MKRTRIMSPLVSTIQAPIPTQQPIGLRKIDVIDDFSLRTASANDRKESLLTQEPAQISSTESQRRRELAQRALEKRMASKQQQNNEKSTGDVTIQVNASSPTTESNVI